MTTYNDNPGRSVEGETATASTAWPNQLRGIGELINTQDNRCTDQPMFVVFEKRGMVTLDTHDHDRIEWYNPDSVSTADDHKARRLEALHDGGRDTPGWERYAVKDIDVFVTACFTEQGCKDFLARDGHNLNKPFIYAHGSYRNSEFQTLRKWLKSLPGKPAQGFGTFTPGDTDQNADGVWTAGIHVGAHGNKIEVHDGDRKTAEALRDAICTAVIGKAFPAGSPEQATLPDAQSDQRI